MNFIDGSVDGGVFRFDGGQVEVGGPRRPMAPHASAVRPEDLLAGGDGPPLATVSLEVVEQMGHESMAYFHLVGNQQVVRLPADKHHRPGDQIELKIKPGSWHLFASDETGERLN